MGRVEEMKTRKNKEIIKLSDEGKREYRKLFNLLKDNFPGWEDYDSIRKRGNFKFIMNQDMRELEHERLIGSQISSDGIWHYRLTMNGFNFLNALETKELTERVTLLTGVMIFLIFIQLGFNLIQILIMMQLG